MAFAVANPYRQAIRNPGVAITYTVDATSGGVPVAGATGMSPVGGTITDTTRPGVRRVLNLELAPSPGLFDLLAPTGTLLTVTAHVRLLNRTTVDIPMGVFDIDSQSISVGRGSLTLTAPDKWARIQRARFIGPQGSLPGVTVKAQIAALITDALGTGQTVITTATSTATMGWQVWEKDRDKTIQTLAASIGAWVYFDRTGSAVIADVPTVTSTADWLADASKVGVLIGVDRKRDRADARNVIVVTSTHTGGELFGTLWVWDNDPSSLTYAGPDPMNHPELAGPFGIVPDYLDSPDIDRSDEAYAAGQAMLARLRGLSSAISFSQVPNPALDAFDVIDVVPQSARQVVLPGTAATSTVLFPSTSLYPGPSLYPTAGGGTPPTVYTVGTTTIERHVADTVVHPLVHPNDGQHVDGRSIGPSLPTGGS